jgi:PncC family amidohydrolase
LNTLVSQISQILTSRNWHLAVAESATGGLLGHIITQMPGSSAFFWGGVIAYANEVKMQLLQVQVESLIQWGAVSPQVALEMAKGVCTATNTEVGISITGIAGPSGATDIKPVGLYYIGIALPHELRSWRHVFNGSRIENNQLAARTALAHLVTLLS